MERGARRVSCWCPVTDAGEPALLTLRPPAEAKAKRAFRAHASALRDLVDAGSEDREFERARDKALAAVCGVPLGERTALRAALLVITDLARQRWYFEVTSRAVRVGAPTEQVGELEERDRIRRQEQLKRDEQLASPPVREFIQSAERRRATPAGFRSVFSLMRDGRELAQKLKTVRRLPMEERPAALKRVVDPYLDFVTDRNVCPHTLIPLQDVWRYFRHTWANQYGKPPGRNMRFLVRDRAAPNHPVMGLGELGSPIVQISNRDKWIGWDPESFVEELSKSPSERTARWLVRTVDEAVDELYTDDLLEDRELALAGKISKPDQETWERLQAFGKEKRDQHQSFARRKDLKGKEPDWSERAKSLLFTSKRAIALGDLLRCRYSLSRTLGDEPTAAGVVDLLSTAEGQRVVMKIVRKAKAERVGISMADISVCGAVPPYNPLIAGKLAAMLAASPEVVDEYRNRYSDAESEIASAMAGRSIVRQPELVFLGTTSLYGVALNQYSRASVPCERLGVTASNESLRYKRLGRSNAYGTSHYSEATIAALSTLVEQNQQTRVNKIFGEGASPKLRMVREGLSALGFEPGPLLKHHRKRVLYGVALVENLREYLLGMDAEPRRLSALGGAEATAAITDWWRTRWLARRIDSSEALAKVAAHTTTRPIRHGARVELPPLDPDQLALYDDL